MRRQLALVSTALAALTAAAQHQFSVHDDLLAFPQFQLAFLDAYILEADAQSKLDFTSAIASGKASSQTTHTSADNAPSVRTPAGDREGKHGETGPELPQSYEYMMLDKTPYLCSIPQVEEETRNDTQSAADEAENQKELDRARIRGSELIGAMDENCLYYVSGWWSYSFCYNAEVKQFHQLPPGRNGIPFHPPQEDKNVPAYILGQYIGPQGQKAKEVEGSLSTDLSNPDSGSKAPQKATDLVQVQSKGNSNYLVQKLDDGTTCDLTGRPRKIEVQYHCNPQTKDRIGWIKEISTCSYLMVIYTSRLCDDVAFSPPKENDAHQIICSEIVPEDKLEDWKARRNDRKLAELLEQGEAVSKASKQVDGKKQATTEKATKPTIGGIVVGGMKTVGMPGKRIEPPQQLVAPPKDQATKVDVIAQFDPKKHDGNWMIASDEDLKKLGADPALVKEMAEEMYNHQNKRKWRIEIAQTPRGGELRGIIDDDEEQLVDERQDDGGSEEEYYRDEL